MHFDQNVLFVVIVAIVGIYRLLSRIAENARERTQANKPHSTPSPSRESPPLSADSKPTSDEERIRKFLEALGQPAGTTPPPKVMPRTNLPPRPLAPVRPSPSMRPFSPVFSKRVGEKMRKIPPRSQSTSALARHANEPGAWIAEEERIEVAAAKFEAASASAYGQTRSIRTSADPIWKQLLQSADSARSAIVLREIFGPPRGLQPLEFSL